jgi:hypothetical protein
MLPLLLLMLALCEVLLLLLLLLMLPVSPAMTRSPDLSSYPMALTAAW